MYNKIRISSYSIILFLLLFGFAVFAQQEPQFTQNMFNTMAINPGFAGSKDAICATGLIRQQWVGFKDEDGNKVAPETFLISINSPVNILHGGLGATIIQDNYGFFKDITLKIAYAYRFDIGMGNLGLGLNIGFLNQSVDFSKFNPIQANDPLILNSEESDMMLDFGAGAYYLVPNKYYIGLSTTQITQTNAEYASENNIVKFYLKRHYYLTAGYEYTLPRNPSFEIDPSLLLKSDGVKNQIDIACLLKYNNKVWGGVNYRIQDAICVILGLKIKDIRIGYSYDINTSAIGSSGSHEIMVGYCFKIDIESGRRSYKNTRFL